MKIWKYQIEITDTQTIDMPKGAQVLAVQVQHGVPCVWALVDPEATAQPLDIHVLGTGHPVPDGIGRHLGTFQVSDGALVFHVFERGEAA